MDKDKYEISVKVAEKMIADANKSKETAISRENWGRAAELESYIQGMEQILIVFGGLK